MEWIVTILLMIAGGFFGGAVCTGFWPIYKSRKKSVRFQFLLMAIGNLIAIAALLIKINIYHPL